MKKKKENIESSFMEVQMKFSQGTYYLKIEYPNELFLHYETIKIVVI